jgi:hypothetical protein
MRRREFITALGGAAETWPVAAKAQQGRRIGVLMARAESDPAFQAFLQVFRTRIHELGWRDGDNVRIDYRWTAGIVERFRTGAKELVALRPDVILADATPSIAALRGETQTIPIVFVTVNDPLGSGFIASFHHYRLYQFRVLIGCPSNGLANTKPSDLPHINPIGTDWRVRALLTCPAKQNRQHLILGPESPQPVSLFPGKGNFRPEKIRKWRTQSNVVSAETDANEESADVDRPAKNARIITQNNKTPGVLDGCPTRGVGRTPTMFHNTLVVGSSPTSSTTQSPSTGEIVVQFEMP